MLDHRLLKLLKHGTVYADSKPLMTPVGTPSSLMDPNFLKNNSYWKFADENEWRRDIEKDDAQIPHLDNREGYCPGYDLGYWVSGYGDYRKTIDILRAHRVKGGRYLDFGGSSGRVFRHFHYQTSEWDVWSCDYKPSSMEFNLKYFPKKIKTFLNNALPVLPLEDNYFDLITAFSVFTHINEPEISWLLELRRILRPGGIAYISYHDEVTWESMSPSLKATVDKYCPNVSGMVSLPEGKTVATFREDDPYNCNVFHSKAHVENVWGRYFDILELRPKWVSAQAVAVLRKPV